MRVLAAMSGGVDSAVAAARAAEAGHDVTGVHLALSKNPQTYRSGARGCCTLEDSRDARRAADIIGIPFYVWDMSERFHNDVVEDFLSEYSEGRTPNPCLRCNEKIKFEAVLDRAMALGFDAVVTGHYAQLTDGILRRAVDPGKDQSYVLAVLTRQQLAHSMFPLGDTPKEEVREEAERRGLAVARKPDSHDICFIADGDTRGFLNRKLGEKPGEFIDATTGEAVGEHRGSHQFTIGQRHGLGLGRPAADGKPRYVLSITPVDNTVTVGPKEALQVDTIHTKTPVWLDGQARTAAFDCEVQLRAHGEVYPAHVTPTDTGLTARLAKPAYGVAAGQALVVYQPQDPDDVVIASGTITATESPALVEAATNAN
ncbi:tRNA 2-thiouridine(34) synthase MnmA [Natronoglycomyces albus]|uniref:tRNA-specific 2-thiouridylase MnmA n=1 Tax=Natronoglycomyces albus TaxID=2811108 RepID=A0A895XU30_9ACTN|nr:tRNA 2-thiouridine(34) synthase MnmA [Natronoglycomyces albus]QSB06983.1 tRNA 2-thiouridine(34) synthase MnmA [Natronoglycomyces albus]